MSVIYGNPITMGGGGADLNIDFGSTPPTDTSKLWVPLGSKPDAVECSPIFNYGPNRIEDFGVKLPEMQKDTPIIQIVDGIMYIIGGAKNGSSNPVNTITTVDLATKEISTKSYKFPVGINNASSAVINGNIYVLGGNAAKPYSSAKETNTVYKYDVTAGTIEQVGTLNASASYSRNNAVAIGTDIFYIYGETPKVYKYDTVTNTVSLCPNSTGITNHSPCVAVGNLIFYFRGYQKTSGTTDNVYVYDTSAQQMTQLNGVVCPIAITGAAGYVGGNTIFLFDSYDSLKIYTFDVATYGIQELSATVINAANYRNAVPSGLDIYLCGSSGIFDDIDKFTTDVVLENNKLLLQADFGFTNPFPIVNDGKTKITAYLRNAYLGDSNNHAKLTNAFIYDATANEWKTLSGESYVADMLTALATLGVT